MAASEIRRRILEEHAELRAIAGGVLELAGRVAGGEPRALGALRLRGLELHERLCQHLDMEDEFLVPALRDTGEGGLRRVEALCHEHKEQRALLEYLLERLSDPSRPSVVLGRELRNFAELLFEDMDHEESSLLSYLERRRD